MMPVWLIGLLVPIVVSGLVLLMSKYKDKIYTLTYSWGKTLRNLGMGYDIPIIGGKTENNIKQGLFSFIGAGFRGLARGIAGLPKQLPEEGDDKPLPHSPSPEDLTTPFTSDKE